MKLRACAPADLGRILEIQKASYTEIPQERGEVLAEKFMLFPVGCRVYVRDERVEGYLFSHPGILDNPPKLDTALHAIPENADCYFIHDVVVAPNARGDGAGALMLAHAERVAAKMNFNFLALVAVQDSRGYWEKHGFSESALTNSSELPSILSGYQSTAAYLIKKLNSDRAK